MSKIYKIYSSIIPMIRKNKSINYFLFGFYPKGNKFGEYWDWTTLEIRKILKRKLGANSKFLDVGTGPYGVLSIYSSARLRCKNVLGVDYINELIEYAKQFDPQNKVTFLQSDLFEKITGKFDIIAFNTPYIDTQKGKVLGIIYDDLSEKRWTGGVSGIQSIKRFLKDLPDYLNEKGICILGVNHFHLDEEILYDAIIKSDVELVEIKKNLLTKSYCYILEKEKNA
jgi:release factor glutamine methyltransferase